MNETRIEELRAELADSGDSAERLGHLLELARHLNYVQPAEGVALAREAVALARERADPRLLASGLVTLGGNLAAAGHGDEALARLNEGRVLCEAVGDDTGAVFALSGSGYVHVRRGRFDEAVLAFQRALSGPAARTPPEVRGPVIASLGHVYGELGHVPSAVMCLTQALDLQVSVLSPGTSCAAAGHPATGVSMTSFSIEEAKAQCDARLDGVRELVRTLARQAPGWRIGNAPELRSAIRIAGLLNDLGWLWSIDARDGSGLDDDDQRVDRLRRARHWLQLARRVFRASGPPLGVHTAEGNVAEVWQLRGRHRQAEALLESRAARIRALDNRLLWQLWCLAGAEAALSLGKPQAALDWLRPFAADGLDTEDSRQQADACLKLTRAHLQLGEIDAAQCWLDAADRARRRLHRRALLQSGRLFAAELQLATLQAQMQALGRRAEDLDRRAQQDGLTGLWNRTHFDAKLAQAVRHAEQLGAPLALMMIDIDHFKRINDTYSHLAGDQVLRRVAQEVARCLRMAHDTVARFGGEEFVALAPGLPFETAQRVAQNLCDAVRRLSWPDIDASLVVTVSIGIAAWAPGLSARGLLENADQQLYSAKHAGRDRFMPPRPEPSE